MVHSYLRDVDRTIPRQATRECLAALQKGDVTTKSPGRRQFCRMLGVVAGAAIVGRNLVTAEAIERTIPDGDLPATLSLTQGTDPEHWSLVNNGVWRWYEREHFIDGRWQVTGMTRPVDIELEEAIADESDYLAESDVPGFIWQAAFRE